MDDPYDLQRYLDAQAGTIDQALAELAAGAKRTHWMWFVFPQIAGLGHSAMAQRYAISGLDEARAYLAHPVLGERLRRCTGLAIGHAGRGMHALFGSPDDMKFRSSMTLFAEVDDAGLFGRALDACCAGQRDQVTLARL
jgi:uncharacterized protein (DUF1810 family)